MRRFKCKRSYLKLEFYIIVIGILVLSIFMVNRLGFKMSSKLILISKNNIKMYNDKLIMDYIDTKTLKKDIIDNIIQIVKNDKEEIIAVDYKMTKGYQVMEEISKRVKDGMSDISYDDFANYHGRGKSDPSGFILFYPIGLASDNIFLNNLGYKVPVKIRLNSSLLTGFSTKVSNYGINNALVELYLNVDIKSMIITPVVSEEIKDDYSVLISAKLIVGNVPSYLNGTIENQSPVVDNS